MAAFVKIKEEKWMCSLWNDRQPVAISHKMHCSNCSLEWGAFEDKGNARATFMEIFV